MRVNKLLAVYQTYYTYNSSHVLGAGGSVSPYRDKHSPHYDSTT